MSKLNFKTISTLMITGFLSIQSLNATSQDRMDQESNPSTNPLVRVANEEASASNEHFNHLALLRAQVPVELQNAAMYCRSPNQWLMTYMGLVGCDTPILEALLPNLRPTNAQVQAFYAWVKANPEQNLSFSPALTQSIRVIASIYDPNLAQINLMNRQITTLPHNLWGLSNITSLYLAQNQIVDVSPLRHLTQLTVLYLHQNQIVDVSPLRHLTQLAELYLPQNQIVDVSPLRHLTQLKGLFLHQNQIVDVSPLATLTQLQKLYLAQNQIVDVSSLATLTRLKWLFLHQNQIVDVSPLATLTQLTWLELSENQIVDVSPLRYLTQLTELNLAQNQIVDVAPLATLTQLQSLSLAQNRIVDVSRLAELNELKSLTLWGNPEMDRYEKQQRVQEYFTSNTELYLKDRLEPVRGTRP